MKRTINQTAKRSLKTKKAFTLVELLVVIAIIGILFVVLISKVDFATDKAKTVGVQNDFRSYQLALQTVGMEQQGFTNDMDLLAEQLNKNLDPKLQVTVVDDKLTTEAEDPWGTQYTITYSEPENARGKIIITSAGADRTVGTDDDYNIVIEYAITSNGGSVNIEFVEGRLDGITPPAGDGEGGSGGEAPVVLAAGVYDAEGTLLADWATLTKPVDEGGYGMNIEKKYTSYTYKTNSQSPYYILTNSFPSATKVIFGDGVTQIGDFSFYECSNITDLKISDGVTSIGESAFHGCKKLVNLTLPDTLTSIGSTAFRTCSFIELTIPGSVLSIGINAFWNCSKLQNLTILNGTEVIKHGAFKGCTSLSTVSIPSSLTTIEETAFMECTSLAQLTIPDSVTSIGAEAFQGCTGLTNIAIPGSVNSISSSAFYGCTGLTSVTINKGVGTVESNAFYGCTGLLSVSIPDSVTAIKDYAFRKCTGLTSINIPGSVNSIGPSAFYGCTGLASIIINKGVTTIESSAFKGCTSLSTVSIPDSVTSIGQSAFSECENLTSVTLLNPNAPALGSWAFKNCTALTTIYVPAESVDTYKGASGWSSHASKIQAIPAA